MRIPGFPSAPSAPWWGRNQRYVSAMPTASGSLLTIQALTSLSEIAARDWDALAHGGEQPNCLPARGLATEPESFSEPTESNPEEADPSGEAPENTIPEDRFNPFVSHAFLSSLEDSASVGGRTGWQPLHLVARDADGKALGAVPVYAKTHSRGEYVFDHAFVDAYQRAGGSYYPKLQISVPFTPATGRRLLVSAGERQGEVARGLIAGLEGLRAKIGASSVHATFLTLADRDRFLEAGYLLRNDQQFHFANQGYRNFDDFLADLASRKRKVLKRERREALAPGIEVEWVTGKALTEAHWDAFFAFYMDTGSRKWGSPYLTRRFFSLVGERMAERTLLILAKRAGRYVAGALNFIGENTLYGRNWGAIEHHPFLHFELCYYQAIDFAIAHRLARVEAGAQGEHKLARGYRPVKTHTVHRFADQNFQRAVAGYLLRERAAVEAHQQELGSLTPFRRGGEVD